jgi:hypothetical protein
VVAPELPRAMGARGGPGAAPSREREPEPWGHVAAPELPRAAETHGGFKATLSREAGAVILT